VYGWPYYGSGYYPYYGYSTYYPDYGVDSTYSPSIVYNDYVPSGTTVSGYSSPDTSVAGTPAVATDDTQQASADNTAHLKFIVPENATIWVEGQKTNQTGTEREFVTPELTPGKRFFYSVRVRSRRDDGKVVDETRKIYVRAGDRWRVDFAKPAQTVSQTK
jgi:uncharacterized protein (TIGR03000 family)